ISQPVLQNGSLGHGYSFVRISRERRRTACVVGCFKLRFHGHWGSTDSGAGKRGIRHCPCGWGCELATRSAADARLCRSQESEDGNGGWIVCGISGVGGSRTGAEDFRVVEWKERLSGRG